MDNLAGLNDFSASKVVADSTREDFMEAAPPKLVTRRLGHPVRSCIAAQRTEINDDLYNLVSIMDIWSNL